MTDSIRRSWENFYKTHYGLELDFSGVLIPPELSRPHLLAIIAKGLTLDQVFDALPFPKGKYGDCDFDLIAAKNDRSNTEGHYAVRLWPGFSFDEGGPGGYYPSEKVDITLLERLILEHKVYNETGKHLASAICTASRELNVERSLACKVYIIRYGDLKGQIMVSTTFYDADSCP